MTRAQDTNDENEQYAPRPIADVMRDAVEANESAGIPDPVNELPMNHTSDGTDESEWYDAW